MPPLRRLLGNFVCTWRYRWAYCSRPRRFTSKNEAKDLELYYLYTFMELYYPIYLGSIRMRKEEDKCDLDVWVFRRLLFQYWGDCSLKLLDLPIFLGMVFNGRSLFHFEMCAYNYKKVGHELQTVMLYDVCWYAEVTEPVLRDDCGYSSCLFLQSLLS